jgi:uncharacterized protein HemY
VNKQYGRFQTDLLSSEKPLRELLVKIAKTLIQLDEYKSALSILNIALCQAESVQDIETIARCTQQLALIKARSGVYQNGLELLEHVNQFGSLLFRHELIGMKHVFLLLYHNLKFS